MPLDLTERQMALARWLADSILKGEIDETFHAVWGTGLSDGQWPILIWRDGEWKIVEFAYGEFNALAEEGLLHMRQDAGYPFPKGVKGYCPTERHYSCTVKQSLIDTFKFTSSENTVTPMSTQIQFTLDVFISHSGKDTTVAKALIELLRAALDVPHARIRCTSVDGYRLPAGASTDDHLKKDVRGSACLIGLLTQNSLRSLYVLFELGARWGAGLPFFPLLARGASARSLGGPMSGINALSSSSASQVHQLLDELGTHLGKRVNSAANYEECLRKFMDAASEAVTAETLPVSVSEANRPSVAPLSDAAKEMLQLIESESKEDQRGIVEIAKELRPGQTNFFPRIEYAGEAVGMKTRTFRTVITELLAHKILHSPEDNPSTNTRTYEYIPKAGREC